MRTFRTHGCIHTEAVDDPGMGYPYGHRYNSKARLASFWHQADEVLKFGPSTALEVGPGPGYVAQWLRREGVRVTTVDIDPRVRPDVVASVRRLPFADRAFDVSLCCEVLEHLPFSELPNALRELGRVSKLGIVVSVPDRDRYFRLVVKTPWRSWSGVIEWPRRLSSRPRLSSQEHRWEIGCDSVGVKDVIGVILETTGGKVRTYRVPENPYHRFFVVSFGTVDGE